MASSKTSSKAGQRRAAALPSRAQREAPLTLRNWRKPDELGPRGRRPEKNAIVDCGWGRLIFAHTFEDDAEIAAELSREAEDARDIAFYLRDPHVVLSLAPQEIFLDPSHTYRLWLDQYRPARSRPRGIVIRACHPADDLDRLNALFSRRHMVPLGADYFDERYDRRVVTILAAEDKTTGDLVGAVMGVDHKRAFKDPENGSSLWCLAVDPQAQHPGIGEALVRQLAEHFAGRGRAFLDLSVLHDNEEAIRLYEKLNFRRVPVFALKAKNSINEKLFTGPPEDSGFNPYAQVIIDEARRRGIAVETLDPEHGYFALVSGGRRIVCRESLSELTTAVAMSRCDDKVVTRRVLTAAGLQMPDQLVLGPEETSDEKDKGMSVDAFLKRHGSVVVKPARGEQGRGIAVDLRDIESVREAIRAARDYCEKVIVESFHDGQDLRIIVIGGRAVAAAVRKPAAIVGNGSDTVETLIRKQSRRRAAATGGESRIPLDEETRRCLNAEDVTLESVPGDGEEVQVRKTANLHTGGTIVDVTADLSDTLRDTAERAAAALDIPVVGLDFLTPDVAGNDFVIVEANERPGLANHEPQPTAERFVDLLFP